jgi:hypothetical protein
MVLILSEVGSSERLHQTYLFWQEFYRNKFTLTTVKTPVIVIFAYWGSFDTSFHLFPGSF